MYDKLFAMLVSTNVLSRSKTNVGYFDKFLIMHRIAIDDAKLRKGCELFVRKEKVDLNHLTLPENVMSIILSRDKTTVI